MNVDLSVLDQSERTKYMLRQLYMSRGFSRYKMSKFEEYDLYSRNKSFLVSDEVITFTDLSGKLMALKPDVTLSIIKNTPDDGKTRRLCYDENVYRVSKGVRAFREIMQVGAEVIGDVGEDEIYETLLLALKSLNEIRNDYILEVSDLGILSSFIEALGIDSEAAEKVIKLAGEKNLHEIGALCEFSGADKDATIRLLELMKISASPHKAISALSKLNVKNAQFIGILEKLCDLNDESRIKVDFSLSGNMSYYNGVIFKGYINGVPESVLSGGQYDGLMQKLGKKARAIGFAVYLDRLERLEPVINGGE